MTTKQWLVNWSDDTPTVVDTDRLLMWWPDFPEIRARILSLEVGEAWVDTDLSEGESGEQIGVPLCSVIRLADKEPA